MGVVPIYPKKAQLNVDVPNGQTAFHTVMSRSANSAYARPVCVASQIYNTTNSPTLTARGAWAVTGDTTTNVRACSLKLRADMPTLLGSSYNISGTKQVDAEARLVLYNAHKTESVTVGKVYVYQGDPTDSSTYWLLEENNTWVIPPEGVVEIAFTGLINPLYCHNVKIDDDDINTVFVDAGSITGSGTPKVLFFSLYMKPPSALTDTDAVPIITQNQMMLEPELQDYITNLYLVNKSFHAQNVGTLCPVSQYSGNDVYGYSSNLYTTNTYYHQFLSGTSSTSETAGSIWVPLKGLGVYCYDGYYRYKIRVGQQVRCSTTCSITFYPYYFLKESITGVAISTWTLSATANTDYTNEQTLTITTATPFNEGIAICPMAKKSSATGNTYLYTSLFSAKAVPYDYI